MKVAMVSEHANPLAAVGGVDGGGQNVHVAALATELGRRHTEVVVHTRRESPLQPCRVPLAPGVWVDHVTAGPPEPVPKDDLLPYIDELATGLRRAWRRHPPDVVHAHFWMSGRAALAAARPLGIPVVQTFHALGSVKRRWQAAADTSPACRVDEERAIIAGVDHIVATCSDEVFELVRLGADPHRVTVIPCGVDLSLFRSDGPMLPRSDGLRRIAVVGRLVERKGIADAITALAGVPGAELMVAGGPEASGLRGDPEACRLVEIARAAGVGDRVRFTGRLSRAEVAALLRSSDVFVTVPWYEPFGMGSLEAMACGVPVVAANVGGLVDSVVAGETGLLVPPRDPAVLTRALNVLLRDERRRLALGQAGRHRARWRYGWPMIAGATARVYATVGAAAHDGAEPTGGVGAGAQPAEVWA